MTRGYLWQDLPTEIVELFASLATQPAEPTLVHAAILVEDRIRLNIGEQRRARARIGDEWWQKMIVDASRRGRETAVENKKKAKEYFRPRGGAVSTPRLEEKRAADRARQIAKTNRRRAMRERLPDDRAGLTHHFAIITKSKDGNGTQEIDGYIQTGTYADGKLGEIFLKVSLPGDEFVMLDQWSIAVSVALQFGAPVSDLFRKFVGQRFWPDGPTTNKDIPRCTSPVDYVARWVLSKYGPKEGQP